MQIPHHVFKAYDIRGLVDTEITPLFAYNLGKAFATFLREEEGKADPVVTVGRDMRESSFELQRMLMEGLVLGGCKVLDIGLISTPAFYFAVSHLKADGGIMVSASHNPAKYNGFKITREKAIAISGETGIKEMGRMMERETFDRPPSPGDIEEIKDIPAQHAAAEIAFANVHRLPRFKIVADSANGMGAQYLDETFKKIDMDVTRMFWDFDGRFPNHEADPFKLENTVALRAKVVELGADIGIATDGDGDRIFFIDDKGEMVEPAILRGIVAQAMLRRFPGATICYDIRPGRITEDLILESGGRPVVTRVGHALIKEKMREVNAVFAGESSGHFYMKMPEGSYEAPIATMLILLSEMMRAEGKKLSDIVAPLKKYSHSGEINYHVEDKTECIDRIKEYFHDGDQMELDGLTVTYPDFWFNVRASNTEPVLRMNLEAKDEETMVKRRDEVAKIIENR
jgi:phosphomannomutase